MAEKLILEVTCILLSFPLVVFSRVAEFLKIWNIDQDLSECLYIIDSCRERSVPEIFLRALIVAEDRRNSYHLGVDPIGITRAIWTYLTKGNMQGASTIEQQFVRVVSRRYETTFARKIREQAVAISLARRRRKTDIANAYLTIAYYGFGLSGLHGLKKICGENLDLCSQSRVCVAISCLKYPQPTKPTSVWRAKIARREAYIEKRIVPKNRPKFMFLCRNRQGTNL